MWRRLKMRKGPLTRRGPTQMARTVASAEGVITWSKQTRRRRHPMRQKMRVLVTLLALAGGGSSGRGADMQGLGHVLDQWAVAWSSNDVETLLPLFTDNVDYEDVTFGAVSHGKNAFRDFAVGVFAT